MNEVFSRWSTRIAVVSGYWQTFILMTLICVVWAVSGPIFDFSDTWQLVINTATTVLTFLMVFLIQNTQNRDALAMHLKLDEIIRSLEGAENRVIRAELEPDAVLAEQMAAMHELAETELAEQEAEIDELQEDVEELREDVEEIEGKVERPNGRVAR